LSAHGKAEATTNKVGRKATELIMKHSTNAERFFLAANTPNGFYSFFDDIFEDKEINEVIIIKGGPGTGKSSFMKRIASQCIEKGMRVEYIHCSSDTDSLDGVIVKEAATAVLDGTSPHMADPKHPGADGRIINLGDFWDEEGIKASSELIVSICASILEKYGNVYRMLKASQCLRKNNDMMIRRFFLEDKMKAAAERMASMLNAEIGSIESGKECDKESVIKRRFMTGITPKGIYSFFDYLPQNYDKIIKINDDYNISGLYLAEMKKHFSQWGINMTECPSPMDVDVTEHILLPEYGYAFITSNDMHAFSGEEYKTVNMQRFIETKKLSAHKNFMRFNEKAAASLINESCAELADIKKAHDELEKCYNPHVRFEEIYKLAHETAEQLSGESI